MDKPCCNIMPLKNGVIRVAIIDLIGACISIIVSGLKLWEIKWTEDNRSHTQEYPWVTLEGLVHENSIDSLQILHLYKMFIYSSGVINILPICSSINLVVAVKKKSKKALIFWLLLKWIGMLLTFGLLITTSMIDRGTTDSEAYFYIRPGPYEFIYFIFGFYVIWVGLTYFTELRKALVDKKRLLQIM